MEEEVLEYFRKIGRGRLKRVWERIRGGGDYRLEGEDGRLARIMEEHRAQYAEKFETADSRWIDPEADIDPFLHVQVHLDIESQISKKDPIEALQLYDSLRKMNLSGHEAVHLLAAIFIPFLFDGLKQKRPFDQESYRRLLKKAEGKEPEKIWSLLAAEVYGEEDAAPGGGPDRVFQFRISLEGTEPPVWRRIQIRSDASFLDLHEAIQAAMGWEDCHLHRFEVPDPRTGETLFIGRPMDDPQWEDNTLPGWRYRVADFMGPDQSRCRYVYDYGDNWYHGVDLEETLPADAARYPRCVAGERACPPEDVGGPQGYAQLLEVLSSPDHPRHAEVRAWAGEAFDPDRFDPEGAFGESAKE